MGSLLYQSLVKTNIFISICAVTMYFTGVIFLGREIRFSADPVIIFISTFLIYNISQNKFGNIFRPIDNLSKAFVFWLSFLTVIVLSLYHFDLNALIYFGHLGIISVLYNSPLLNNYKYLPLRSIPLIKVFLIAYIWANIGVIFPAIDFSVNLGDSIWWMFVAQFMFIIAITLPFDIRDFYKDFRDKLKTIPGVIGVKRTKLVAYGALAFYLASIVFLLGWTPGLLVLGLLTFVMIYRSSASRKDVYYTFYIDGLIILQFLLLLLEHFTAM